MEQENLDLLLSKLLQNKCTDDEKAMLFKWVGEMPDDNELAAHLEKAWDRYEQPTHTLDENTSRSIRDAILNKSGRVERRLPWLKGSGKWYWAAAAAIVIASTTAIMVFETPQKPAPAVAHVSAPKDISAPVATRAVIRLSSGRKLEIGESASGTLTSEEGVEVSKSADGMLAYANNTALNTLVYNTLENPRGSRTVALALSDGTKVWLNSETTLRYPVAFVGNERRVEVSGEAYFEVSADPAKPFRVATGNMVVEVLGTSFNVNAYADEASVKTTLLEGKVKLTEGAQSVRLAPGQQAQFNSNSSTPFKIFSDVDVDKTMAWKNGTFQFDDIELPKIMRQISRWYNVQVIYQHEAGREKFGGNIRMDAPLSDVLTMLEANGVRCHFNGKTIIVGS